MTTHSPAKPAVVPVDQLDLATAVVGDGVILHREDDAIVLHTVTGGAARPLGVFTDVRDAWRALDAIDPAAELLAA